MIDYMCSSTRALQYHIACLVVGHCRDIIVKVK